MATLITQLRFKTTDAFKLVVDIVAGRRPSVWSLHANLFDRIAYEQSMTATDSTELYDIVRKEWNIFIYPQEGEMPDTIFDNLNWLVDRVSRR